MRKGTDFVYQTLVGRLDGRLLAPGMQLPSEIKLAEDFGVSRMTVRKALARLVDEGRVYCRNGVGTFVKQYTPHVMAANRVNIGIDHFPERVDQHYVSRILRAVQDACDEYGSRPVFVEQEKLFIENDEIDAVFCLTTRVNRIQDAVAYAEKKPVVLLNRIVDYPQIGYVAVDYVEVARKIVRRMLLGGAEKILFVGGASEMAGSVSAPYQRELGYRLAHAELKRPVCEELILPTTYSLRDMAERMEQYHPDVVFVSCEYFMTTAYVGVEMCRAKYKKTLSLFCFDDLIDFPVSEGVAFSCGHMPLENMCKCAIAHLTDRVRNAQKPKTIHKIFPMSYYIHENDPIICS